MSLLNDALRDLEKRQSGSDAVHAQVPSSLMGGASRPPSRAREGILMAMVAVMVALLMAVAYLTRSVWLPSDSRSPATVVTLPAPAGADVSVAEREQAPAPVTSSPPVTASGAVPEPHYLPLPRVEEPVAAAPAQAVTPVAVVVAPTPKGETVPKDQLKTPPPAAVQATKRTAPVPQVAVARETLPEKTRETPRAGSSFSSTSVAASEVTAEPRLEKRSNTSPERQDRKIAAEARQKLDRGQRDAAIADLQNWIATGQETRWARLQLAEIRMAQGRLAEADTLLREVDQSSLPEQRQIKALLLVQQGKTTDALQLMDVNLPPVDKARYSFYATLAALQQQTGAPEAAVVNYAKLVDEVPENADWWVGLALALESSGKAEPALKAYRQALTLGGLHPDLQAFTRDRISHLSQQG